MKKFVSLLKSLYQRLERSDGMPGIILTALESFNATRGARASAAMAYYALFSLFPLLIVSIALSSLFVDEQQAIQRIEEIVLQVLPVSRSLIRENLQNIVDLRNTVGIIGLVGLVWSASGVFNVLIANINLAWKQAEMRNFFQQRLLALGIIIALVLTLLLLPLLTSILNLLPGLLLLKGTIIEQPVWFLLSSMVPLVLTFGAVLAVYRWVPNTHVRWKDALWGAFFAAVGLLVVNRGFTFYIRSGLSRYQVIYGSLGAVVALMTWIYLSSLILILGAHLCSAAALHSHATQKQDETP